MLDQKVLHSRKIHEGFKKANKNTVEKVSNYCPKKKIWLLERVKTDDKAQQYYESIVTSGRPKNTSSKAKMSGEVVEHKKPGRKKSTKRSTIRIPEISERAFKLRQNGNSIKKISTDIGCSIMSVYKAIALYEKTNKVKLQFKAGKEPTFIQVCKFIEEHEKNGTTFTNKMISEKFKVSMGTASHHKLNYYKQKEKALNQ